MTTGQFMVAHWRPLAMFFAGWKLVSLGAGIGMAAAFGLTVYVYERRRNRPAMIVRVALVLVDDPRRGLREPDHWSLCDVAPTILELLGIEQPASWTGTSLLKD